ncbi:lipopolysaccharide kinase InaA family protein, partial [Arthrospira platensis SPKY2]
ARAVRRLHNAGLAHSDLSNKNVLIDPTSGECLIIDIDSLVVPQLFPPDVLGTRGYIAPEVLSTIHLPLNDPQRKHPSTATDQHALAVLLYQYLLGRHPLEGPRTYPATSAEEQERLEMGSKALFVEHPRDISN